MSEIKWGSHQRPRTRCKHRYQDRCNLWEGKWFQCARAKIIKVWDGNYGGMATGQSLGPRKLRYELQGLDEFGQCCRQSRSLPQHLDQPQDFRILQVSTFQCLFSISLIMLVAVETSFASCALLYSQSVKESQAQNRLAPGGSWSSSVQQFAITWLRPEHMSLISACRSRRCWNWDAPNAQWNARVQDPTWSTFQRLTP